MKRHKAMLQWTAFICMVPCAKLFTFASFSNNCGDRTKKRTRQKTIDRERGAALIFNVYRWQNKTEEQASREAQAGRQEKRVN